MLTIKVEATSANICVGFDVLGLSLDIYNEFTFELKNEFSFKGFDKQYSNINNNLVYDAYKKVFDKVNVKPLPVEIGYKGDIPVSRGLGSSSSLIVAGVFAANYFLNNKFSKDELFQICADMEGHPDNVAPAIYGGLVASYKANDIYKHICYDVSKDLSFYVIIPPFKISTHDARKVLPTELSYKDINNNLSRIVNIPYAFKNGDINLLKDLFNDKLHEPYRAKLIKGFDEIKAEALKNDSCLSISGSGSTMLLITKDKKAIEKINTLGYKVLAVNVGTGVKVGE